MSERTWSMNIIGHGEEDPRTLRPHPLNPKVHPPEHDGVIEGSLDELGWLMSVTKNVTTGHMLNGHWRVARAIARGEATVPVEYVEIPEDKEPAALLLLDPSGQLAQTHLERWAALRAEAQTTQPALEAFFAQQAALQTGAGLLGPPDGLGTTPEPPAPEDTRGQELQAAWGTAPGQVWACGEHRVVCGDSTQAAVWAHLEGTVGTVRGCFTSPPYAEQRAEAYGGVPAEGYVAWFRAVVEGLARVLAGEGSFFLNVKEHSEGIRRPVYVHELVVTMVRDWGWAYLDEFCWPRPGVPGDPVERGKFKNMWEPVFWFARQVRPVFHPERAMHHSDKAIIDTDYQPGLGSAQGTGRDFLGAKERRGPGLAYPGNRLPLFGSAEALGQPAAFPVDLPQWFLPVYSDVGDWWVDPFLGSGTMLMACAATGRRCWGVERDPRYVAITLERYAASGGPRPVLVE
jgi:site-specific DNA-methyltransferase (adenine-specific)